jgi:hypothetical protein
MTAPDSPLDQALEYAERGYRVFPARDKSHPLVKWRTNASTDLIRIVTWWKRWPHALICTPTGEIDVVLDVDPPAGLDTLETFGWPFGCWFVTPTSRTPRGGLHAHFRIPEGNIRNTTGQHGRGIGVNLDWRGLGGYVVMPSPGSGYSWDEHLGLDTPLMEVPPELLPREPVKEKRTCAEIDRPAATGLDRYAEDALDDACRKILAAPNGQQEATLNSESFAIGTLAGSGGISEGFARDTLRWAASRLVSYKEPWRPGEAEAKAEHAFDAGMRHPRGARCHA